MMNEDKYNSSAIAVIADRSATYRPTVYWQTIKPDLVTTYKSMKLTAGTHDPIQQSTGIEFMNVPKLNPLKSSVTGHISRSQ